MRRMREDALRGRGRKEWEWEKHIFGWMALASNCCYLFAVISGLRYLFIVLVYSSFCSSLPFFLYPSILFIPPPSLLLSRQPKRMAPLSPTPQLLFLSPTPRGPSLSVFLNKAPYIMWQVSTQSHTIPPEAPRERFLYKDG